MSLPCTRCEGTGYLNAHQLPDGEWDHERITAYLHRTEANGVDHDIVPCDCCGNGEIWYAEPGQHYGPDDPRGPKGPYASNGSLCRCH